LKILFIGGTGNISSAVSLLALNQGYDLYLLNRSGTNIKAQSSSTKVIQASIHNEEQCTDAKV